MGNCYSYPRKGPNNKSNPTMLLVPLLGLCIVIKVVTNNNFLYFIDQRLQIIIACKKVSVVASNSSLKPCLYLTWQESRYAQFVLTANRVSTSDAYGRSWQRSVKSMVNDISMGDAAVRLCLMPLYASRCQFLNDPETLRESTAGTLYAAYISVKNVNVMSEDMICSTKYI